MVKKKTKMPFLFSALRLLVTASPRCWECGLRPLVMAALVALVAKANAAIYVNANTTNALNSTSAWLVNGVMLANLPGSGDTVLISGNTAAGITAPLGASLSVYGWTEDTTDTQTFRVNDNSLAALTLGTGGINKTNNTTLQFSCDLALGANQTWTNTGGEIMLDRNSLTLNGYNLKVTGSGTLDLRLGGNMACGTNVTIQCPSVLLNNSIADVDFGASSNTFRTLTIYSGTAEGSSFPPDAVASTTSAFGNASSGTINLNGGPSTVIYNGNTASTPRTFTFSCTSSGANSIEVSTPGQTLTLTSTLLYANGSSQTADQSWNFGGTGNLTIYGPIGNASGSSYKIGVTKNDAGALTLLGTNTYSGITDINCGTLALSGKSSIYNSLLVSVAGGAMFDVSGLSSTFVLKSRQTLSNSASATGLLKGNINASNGIIAVSINGTVPAFNVSSGSLMISTNTVCQIDDNVAASGIYPLIVSSAGGTITGPLPPVSLSRGAGYLQLNAGELDLVVQVPQFISQPADTRADRGTSASFAVSVNYAQPYTLQWRKNGVAIFGATNAVLNLTNVQFADMALYDCVVTASGGGTNTSQSATLLVDIPNPIAIGYNHFLPNIPYPQSNPHLSGMFGPIALGSTNHSTYNDGAELLGCALAYLSPASPYYGQQAYCDRLKALIDVTSSYYDTPLSNAGFEAFTFELPYCYYLLKCYHPEQITAAQHTLWERRIEYRSNWTVTNNSNVYTGHYTGAVWLNGDDRQAAGSFMGSIIATNYSRATNLAYVFENVFTKCLLGDGGTHYVGYQNEAGDYHGDSLYYEAWIYLVTGSTPVKNMILGTKNFIPLVDHQLQVNPMIPGGTGGRYSGFYENTTVPPWKTYYHGDELPDCALWKAYFTGDGYNYQIGQRAGNMDNSSGYDSEAVLWAIFYTPGLVGLPAPDNYLLYDRNTLGPRGRFGNWGEAGTSRNIWSSQPEFSENFSIGNTWGISTFVGSFLLDSNNFNAAFQGTAPMFKVNTNAWTDYELGGGVWSYLSGSNGQNQVTKGRQVYGLSACYNVAGNNGTPTAWDAQQQWVFTPDRVIGMCEIQNNASSAVYGLGQQIKLVSGRINSPCYDYKPLITVGSNSWTYGNLQVRVPATSYAGPNSSFEFGIWDEAGDTNSTMLVLNDSASYNNTLHTYPAGTRRYALLEVTYAGQTYSLSPTVLSLAAGLQGFEFTEDSGRKVRMVHNLTGSAVTYTGTMICPYNQLRMLLSWDDTAFNEPALNAGSASISISIPAYGHILLVNSGIADDHTTGYKTYSTLFISAIPTTPTNLLWSVNNNTLTLSWPANYLGWVLQAQTNSVTKGLTTNWVTVSGSSQVTTTTIPLVATNPAVFYRLMYQP